MPKLILAAVAALAVASGAGAQPSLRARSAAPVKTLQPSHANPPSNIELQLQINQLGQRVDGLSSEIAALHQLMMEMKGSLAESRQIGDERYRRLMASTLATCKLLYLHHWAPNGAHPTPGNPYVPDDYCRDSPASIPLPY